MDNKSNVKKRPNDDALRHLYDSNCKYLLSWERDDYQKILEREHPVYDFSLLNDVQLMNIYEDENREDTLSEYFDNL